MSNLFLVWTSSVFSGTINVIASVDTGTLPMPATGVTLTENDNNNTNVSQLYSNIYWNSSRSRATQWSSTGPSTDGTGLTDDQCYHCDTR